MKADREADAAGYSEKLRRQREVRIRDRPGETSAFRRRHLA
jgi:hypothetical protein